MGTSDPAALRAIAAARVAATLAEQVAAALATQDEKKEDTP